MLAHFCKKLRGALAAEKRARLAAEGEVAATEVALLVQAQQQQRQMLQAVGELRRVCWGVRVCIMGCVCIMGRVCIVRG